MITEDYVSDDQPIDGNKMIELSKDLEAAADEFCDNEFNEGSCTCLGMADAFKAGAKWQAEHTEDYPMPEDTVLFQKGVEEGKRLMMEDAKEMTVGEIEKTMAGNTFFIHGFEVTEMDFPFINSQECGYGDKVKVIIVKEDKQ